MEFTDDDFEEETPTFKDLDPHHTIHDEILSDGIPFNTMIEGLPNSDYHNFGGLSSTKFPLMDLSIRAFENRHLFDFDKAVYKEGNLCHDCILLPHLVDDMYIESPTKGLDTRQALALQEENPDKIVVGIGDIEKYRIIAQQVRFIVHFINFETTKKEVSFFHKHKETGLTFQIRPDIYNPDFGMLFDVKSTKANNHREFEKIIEEYNYDLSIAFYYDVLLMCDYNVRVDRVGWVCVPKSKPNIPFVFRCSEELLEKGRSKYNRLLDKYIEYKKRERELGKDDAGLIYDDIAERVAHSWAYRKENYI